MFSIMEMQIKTRRRHFPTTRMATIKKTDINKCWGMENLEPSDIADGNVKGCTYFGKNWQLLKI